MPLGVAPEHIQYFNQNSKIEFENLLNSNQLKNLIEYLDSCSSKTSSLRLGFDIWRDVPFLKGLICSSKWAKIAGQLSNEKELRFAYSQCISATIYSDKTSLLYRKSCIKDLIIGLCLCLKPAKEPESPFFPSGEKRGLFFHIDDDFYLKFPKTSGKYLFIFYGKIDSRYYLQDEENEIEHFFKELGYTNGDFLKDELNPAYRRIHS